MSIIEIFEKIANCDDKLNDVFSQIGHDFGNQVCLNAMGCELIPHALLVRNQNCLKVLYLTFQR